MFNSAIINHNKNQLLIEKDSFQPHKTTQAILWVSMILAKLTACRISFIALLTSLIYY